MALQFTKQETFDLVAWHLLDQGKKSTTSCLENCKESCAYRGDDGLQCAAGCLIPPGKYHPRMEYVTIAGPLMQQYMQGYDGWFGHDMGLVCKLQDIHDMCDVKDWDYQLRELAEDYELSTDIID